MGKRILVAVGVVLLSGSMLAWAASLWKAPATAKAVKNPADKVNGIKLGQALFQENCVICHGKAGKGDGEAAAAMNPRPKSLADKTVQAQTDGELFWKISEGREAMPGWKSLPEKERKIMVARNPAPRPEGHCRPVGRQAGSHDQPPPTSGPARKRVAL